MFRFRPTRLCQFRSLLVAVALSGLGAAVPGAAVSGAAAQAVELLPHRAVYDVQLAAARGSRGMSSVGGRMEFTWTDVCDGWAIDYRAHLRVASAEGRSSDLSWSYTAWESDDGEAFRFFLRRFRDGRETEAVRGKARLDPASGGRAELSEPEEQVVDLPLGTLFPKAHTEAVLDAARAGRQFLFARVFDGTGDDTGLFAVNAIVVGEETAPAPAAAGELLDAVQSWRVQLAFFPPHSRDGTPESEQGLRLYENGVASELMIDYGDFAIDATLQELEALEPAECE